MSRLVNWALGGVAVAIFFAFQSPATPNEAQDVADDAADALSHAELIKRRDELARKLCAAELGPGSQVLWTHDGDLVCRPTQRLVAQGGGS